MQAALGIRETLSRGEAGSMAGRGTPKFDLAGRDRRWRDELRRRMLVQRGDEQDTAGRRHDPGDLTNHECVRRLSRLGHRTRLHDRERRTLLPPRSDVTAPEAPKEQCLVCYGPGRIAPLGEVHQRSGRQATTTWSELAAGPAGRATLPVDLVHARAVLEQDRVVAVSPVIDVRVTRGSVRAGERGEVLRRPAVVAVRDLHDVVVRVAEHDRFFAVGAGVRDGIALRAAREHTPGPLSAREPELDDAIARVR